MASIVIRSTGLYVPEQVISNQELVTAFNAYVQHFNEQHADAIAAGRCRALGESSVEFIEKASGIKRRHVLNKSGILDPQRMKPQLPLRGDDELSIQAEMAVAAAQQALDKADRAASEVDGIIVACSNLQRPYPAVAIEVQAALGCTGYAYDMNVACSSATFAIQAAKQALLAGDARSILVINPEICTAHMNFCERDSHFIFGDACTALLIERVEQVPAGAWEILATKAITQFSNNIRNNFGFLNRTEEAAESETEHLFRQEGRKVFREVCPMVAETIAAQLETLGLTPQDVQRFWLHQANLNMNLLITRKLLGRDARADEAPIVLDEFANTSSAGSVIALHLHEQDLPSGSLGVLCSFGAGYSIGSVVLKKG